MNFFVDRWRKQAYAINTGFLCKVHKSCRDIFKLGHYLIPLGTYHLAKEE